MKTTKNVQSDQSLVKELRSGSPKAYGILFDRYSQRLYYFALGYLKSPSEAEGIVQDVFVKVWEKRTSLKTDLSFKSYIFTIAFNFVKKTFIKRSRVRDYINSEEGKITFDYCTSNQVDYNFLMDRLISIVSNMPERRQETFIKSRFEGLSVKDIAVEMGISPKTVENQITLALKYLRVHLRSVEELRMTEM
ncbi:RNA polymerase sigma-70 factor [uncultured Zobellia sp.]|uniref:RNA polymerase sigma-70 factor n=1 Tax=uncultured Zobellia sp. TaxID=255433 RepID=UPI0025966AEC|nr:RNA polymerase sigma-70 factor [uncultured Zobellia sp.]